MSKTEFDVNSELNKEIGSESDVAKITVRNPISSLARIISGGLKYISKAAVIPEVRYSRIPSLVK